MQASYSDRVANPYPMKLTEMKQILTAGQIHLTKSLGQNFLHDHNQLRRIVDAAEIQNNDQVLEIGPGLGPLTEFLLDAGAKVFAIEKDRRLYAFIREHLGENPKLSLLHADALKHLREQPTDWLEWKLVANLPYSVASTVLVELAKSQSCPSRLVATLQIEVAQRLMASAAHGDYGILTLLMQVRYEAQEWFKIPASCFFPVPEVDSACVVFVRRKTPLLGCSQSLIFEKIVKRGFSQRRKMLMKLLKQDWPAEVLERVFQELGLSPTIRAERVTLEQFVQLTQALDSQS